MGSNRNDRNFIIYARNDGRREFYQHDDRGQPSSSGGNRNPRGRQNYSGRGGNYYQSSSGVNRFQHGNYRGQGNLRGGGGYRRFPQEDEAHMPEAHGGNRHHMYKQMRGKRKGPDGYSKPFNPGTTGWHKMIIKEVGSYPREEVIAAIKELVDDDFKPVFFGNDGDNMFFYLEKNPGVAKAIVNLSGRLTMRNNHRISITCVDVQPPFRKLTPPQLEIVKAVMSDRFSSELKRLDLRNFHNDKTLLDHSIYCPLNRPTFLSDVLKIMLENCPHVEEIDFSQNYITSVYNYDVLLKCSNFKRLYLEKNNIKGLDSFQKLKGLGVIEVNLEGNPLCDKFKDASSYTSAVREIFPKVERLDGIDLPKAIGFEVEDDGNLPPTLPSFFCSEEIKNIAVTFINQYFQVFESNDRKPLEAAYTEDAIFSLSCNLPDNGVGARYTAVIEKENRNLKRVFNLEKRISLLYRGRGEVVNVLCRLPKCLHDPSSFVIDIPFARPCLMHVVLTGVFRQTADKNPPFRSFMKSMVIVPVGSGFCISNEELFINNATVEQVAKAFKNPPTLAASTPVVASPPVQKTLASSPAAELQPAQIELIKQFAVHSKMLPEYCKMCLEKNDWDFSRAGEMFLNLQKENKIPPEYFGTAS